MTTQRKAKRKLTDIDFSKEDSHIALVSKEQGHGANGHHYALVMKAANFSDEFLEKASKVKVELDINDYLTRFYGLWYEDAEILARALGFTTQRMEDEAEDAAEGEEEWSYEDYINEKVASIEIMKSLYETESIPDVLSNLSEDQYLQFLKDQELVEKAFKKIDKACADKGKKPVKKNSPVETNSTTEDKTSVASEVISEGNTSVVKNKDKEKSMAKEVQVIEQEVEVIAKSQFDEIQKQFENQQVELQKALDLVKQFEAEKKEAISKARKEQLSKACGKHSEVIFKAVGECSDETFAEVVKALAEMQELVEKSALFQEQGVSTSDAESSDESTLAKVIKAKYQKQ